jgi:spermidine synthase
MAMEVVWTRAFAPVLKTQVYSFALVVATYLGATFLGSLLYRRNLRKKRVRSTAELLCFLCACAFLPIVANDARWVVANVQYGKPDTLSVIILLASICPFCAVLGYMTPALIDEHGAGSPRRAGAAYAVNVLGCILGPLCACYLMLPHLSERAALLVLGFPFAGFFLFHFRGLPAGKRWGLGLAGTAMLAAALGFTRTFEENLVQQNRHAVVRRDYAASVISTGEGFNKGLIVNGTGMTLLTPITKFMAHLPLAFHSGKPDSALIICFGMGTTFRSALSWDVTTKAVELVPSVVEAFGYYHSDAAQFLRHPKGQIIVDDGRRYLERTRNQFDVIVIDPPPPTCAAGSSLLYSTEFYELAKQRLKPDGILAAWVPEDANLVLGAAVRSASVSFPYVRCFRSIEGWGVHVLASRQPIPQLTPAQLAARLPANARLDLMEWQNQLSLPNYLGRVLSQEIPLEQLLRLDPEIRITDDRPYNEYFLLRQWGVF